MGNGTVPASQLVTVQEGLQLAEDAAASYIAMRGAGMPGKIAQYGAYRDLALQAALKANPKAYGSSLPSSAIASPGNSTHGLGENADLIDGAREWAIAWGAQYGWHQRDARNDPNCFHYTAGIWSPPAPAPAASTLPAGVSDSDYVKTIATYLNGRKLGKTTAASSNGVRVSPGATTSIYWWLMQRAGAEDGLYPQPAYKINGIVGPKTESLEPIYYQKALAAMAPPAPTTAPVTSVPVPVTPAPVESAPSEPSEPAPVAVGPTPDPTPDPVDVPTAPVADPPVADPDPVVPSAPVVVAPTPVPVAPKPVITPKPTAAAEVNKWLHGGVIAAVIAAAATLLALVFGH